MSTAAEVRREVEAELAGRIPGALSWRPLASPERLSCGVAEVDKVLGGGLPLGAIVELTGAHSSGRTTLALSTLAQATLAQTTGQGESCAYVDVGDGLNPASAAEMGVDLRCLLWVRIARHGHGEQRRSGGGRWTGLEQGLRAGDLLLNCGGFRVVVLDLGEVAPEQARRVPLATWYRFRLQAEKSRTLLLLLSRAACAESCAAVSLHCRQGRIDWQQTVPAAGSGVATLPDATTLQGPRLLVGMEYRVEVERRRTNDSAVAGNSFAYPSRKPPAFAEAEWRSTAAWSR